MSRSVSPDSLAWMVISVVDKIEIRAPRETEREQVFQVYQTGLPNVDRISYEVFLKWWARSEENSALGSMWRVAAVNNKIVGVAINFPSERLHWGVIWELAVAPDWRSKGVGQALVQESQKIMFTRNPRISHFALGVKTHNLRALPFYERLGYSVRALVIDLKGPSHFCESGECRLEPAKESHVPQLVELRPDGWWSHRDEADWRRVIHASEAYTVRMRKKKDIVGFLRFETDFEFEDSTVVSFCYLDGNGLDVIQSASNHAATGNLTFWVQDSHQEILEYLYDHSFQRVGSEYVLLQKAGLHTNRL